MSRPFDLASSGSVVTDYIHTTDRILGPESKGFVWQSHRAPGGVALNHLSWASVLGLQTRLFGPAAEDDEADFLRQACQDLGVDSSAWAGQGSRTSISHIYVDAKGERAIYQELGASTEFSLKRAQQSKAVLASTQALACEISQVKLNVVKALLASARSLGLATFLDLDIAPSQACGTQALGRPSELSAILRLADNVKAGLEAACEVVGSKAAAMSPDAIAKAMHTVLGKRKGQWVAITLGSKGCALADGKQALMLPACKGLKVKDSTGAGDAFMGGLMAGAHYGLDLRSLGLLANACGAACVEQFGAVAAAKGSRERILKLYQGRAFKAKAFAPQARAAQASASALFNEKALCALAGVDVAGQEKALQQARDLILARKAQGRRLHCTGIGKSEYVARYMAASFSSTGTPACFLHGTEAVHGSAGQLSRGDILIAISNSGQTEELLLATSLAKKLGVAIIAVGGQPASALARQSQVFLNAGVCCEGDALGLAPRASVMAQILILQALGVELQQAQKQTAEDFRRVHPGGSLGKGKP
jgi:D-arabinose 5-phosphate isomerase GutQ/sugar/nucleoside kinase (ribokinase family)